MRRDFPITGGGCKALIPNKWYHERQFPNSENHPCPFKARLDGFCDRHHPKKLHAVLMCQKVKLTNKLATVEAQLAKIETAAGSGNPTL
jgi:hypothetical protein